MPDLRPDTSIYPKANPNAGPLGGMSLLDIVRTAQGLQEYQSQQGMTQALQGATDPDTGQIDYSKVGQAFQGTPGFKTPQQFQAITEAGRSQGTFRQWQMGEASKAISSLITNPKGATLENWAQIALLLRQYSVPSEMIAEVGNATVGKDGKTLDPAKLAQLYNWTSGNSGIPTVGTTQPSGQTVNVPAGAMAYPQRGTLPGSYATSLSPDAPQSIAAANVSRENGRHYQEDVFPFETALSKMEDLKAKGQTIGPGSASRNAAQSWVYSLSPEIAKQLGIDPDKLQDYAMVDKYLTQGLMSRAAGFDAHTDARYASLMSGSPTVHTTDLAGIPLVKAQLGIRNMIHTQDYLARLNGDPNFLREGTRLSPMMDPLAYGMKYASSDQIKKMQASVPQGPDRDKLNANIAAGVLSGAIPSKTAGISQTQAQRLVQRYFFSGQMQQ